MPDFEEIYQTYFADVYRYILALSRDAHTAEEVTQETFFRALASIDQFRGDLPHLALRRPGRPGAGHGPGGPEHGVRVS